MERTVHRINDVHNHARSGFDFGSQARGVFVLKLREGRTFDAKDIARHTKHIEHWVLRHANNTLKNATVDMGSFRIYHDETNDQIITAFSIHIGWADEYLCFASTSFEAEHHHQDKYRDMQTFLEALNPEEQEAESGLVN